jgi:phosphoserine aminotransferase
LLTGDFSERAYSDSLKAENGEVYVVASGKDSNFSQIPSNKEVEDNIQQGTGYIHITDNNTLFGTTIYDVPQVEVPIIADMTSSILSRKIEVSKYALIYAGFQKNIGPSGTALVIIRDDLYDKLP